MEHSDAVSLLVAGSFVVGGLLVGLGLRWLFAGLARRARRTANAWDDLGWSPLRSLALPAAGITGVWLAAQVLKLESTPADLLNRGLLAAGVLAVALAVAGLAGGIVQSVTLARSGVAQSATIFVNLTKLLVLAVGGMVVLQSLGISITPLVTALGVGGLAAALALQDTLANLFAGVQVLASRKLQVGDFIRLDSGEDGYVVDITWRNTTIRALAGNIVVIPNSRLANAVVTNFHQPAPTMDVWFTCGVSYASDLEQVERVTVEVAREVMETVPGGVPGFEPAVRFSGFNDSSIDFTVIMQTTEFVAQYRVVHEFVKRLHARYRSEGIEIPFPIRTLIMGDGVGPTPELIPAARDRHQLGGQSEAVAGGS